MKDYKVGMKAYGSNLIGGMKQRIGLYRAQFKAKKWLFIDKTTSSID